MSLTETAALEITAVRAIESADSGRSVWSDEDRAWATRAAAAYVGSSATSEAFLAARADLALQRLRERSKPIRNTLAALQWRPWVGYLIVALAFVIGFALDQIGANQRINLLAPPLFGVLLWNLAVYVLLFALFVVRYGEAGASHPLRRLLVKMATGRGRGVRGDHGALVVRIVDEWTGLAQPVYAARAARVLHLAAAALACGLLAGLYARGVALEYAAGWESTFLDASSVRTLLAAALAPGAAWTGIPVPSLQQIEAIRAPAGENAARWLHLIAATFAALVILPRFVLAAANAVLERYRTARLIDDLEAPYFARLLRGFAGGPVRVRVVPYSYTLSATATAALERLLRAVFGDNASVIIGAPVAYGATGLDGDVALDAGDTHLVVLFNATGTPERDVHGAFLASLASRQGSGSTAIALVDDGPFRQRAENDARRLEQRQDIWRAMCEESNATCAFATLDPDEVEAAIADFEAAIERAER